MLETYCDNITSKTVKKLREELGNETDEEYQVDYQHYKNLFKTKRE